MKKLVVIAVFIIMLAVTTTACNGRRANDSNTVAAMITETGISVAEDSQIRWIRHSFLTDNRLRSLSLAISNREYLKSRGELVTEIKVEADSDWPGWYRAVFKSTMSTIAE